MLWFFAVLAGITVSAIIFFLAVESIPFISDYGVNQSLTKSQWYPQEGLFGIFAMMAATILCAFGSLMVTAPLGLAGAIFIRFYSKDTIRNIFRSLIELYAGIPSVVVGFWGLVVLVPLVGQWQAPGAGLFTAIIVLSIMTLPTIVLVIDSAITGIPKSRKIASRSLALSKETYIFKIVLPEIKPGIVAAVVLQLGRALGETMAVLMVCGNIPQLPDSLFSPVRTLTSNMALEMAYAVDLHRSSLFFTGLVLTLLVSVLVFIAAIIFRRSQNYAE